MVSLYTKQNLYSLIEPIGHQIDSPMVKKLFWSLLCNLYIAKLILLLYSSTDRTTIILLYYTIILITTFLV
jgi:formate/nitrite transporter FocA (FNT family)